MLPFVALLKDPCVSSLVKLVGLRYYCAAGVENCEVNRAATEPEVPLARPPSFASPSGSLGDDADGHCLVFLEGTLPWCCMPLAERKETELVIADWT